MIKKLQAKIRGYSLLEQAVVLPVILGVVFGAIDINNTIQSYSGLKEAVNTALRCVYTVDGKCVLPQSDSRTRFYDYYLTTYDATRFYPEYDYAGEAKHFRLPILENRNFSARVLNSVSFDIPRYNYTAALNLHNIQRTASFNRRTAFMPYMTGGSARAPSTFRYLNGTADFTPGTLTETDEDVVSPVVTTTSGSETLTLSSGSGDPVTLESGKTFSVLPPPGLDASRPCHKAFEEKHNPNDFLGPHEPWNTPGCGNDNNFIRSDGRVRAVLHIRGNTTGTNSDACGSVIIRLQRRINGSFRDADGDVHLDPEYRDDDPPHSEHQGYLGGQAFRGANAQANFIPRGANAEYVGVQPGYVEWTKYSPLFLQYGQDYRILFTLERRSQIDDENGNPISCSNGELNFQFTGLDVYVPRFQGVTQALTCNELVPENYDLQGAQCTFSTQIPPSVFTDAIARGVLHHTDYGSVVNAYNEVHARSLFHPNNQYLNQFRNYYNFSVSGVGAPASTTQQCGACRAVGAGASSPNFGVPQAPDQNGNIYNSPEALSVCPPLATQVMNDYGIPASSVTNVRWTETNCGTLNPPPVQWAKQNCFFPPPTQSEFPGDLPQFAKLHWTGPHSTGNFTPFYSGRESAGDPPPNPDPHDPDYMKAHDPNYNCPDITVRRTVYDSQNADIPRDSLFVGRHPNMNLCDWRAQLRSEAEHLGMNADSYFLPAQDYVNEAQGEPASECADWRLREGQPLDSHKVEGGPFPEGTVPAECHAPGVTCIARFNGFGGGDAGSVVYDTARAEQVGKEALSNLVAWSRFDCEGPRCAKLQVTSPEDAAIHTAEGSMEVPINLLFNHSVTVHYRGEERWEGEYAR